MNLEKVIFGFFIVLAMTLNFGFFLGEMLWWLLISLRRG